MHITSKQIMGWTQDLIISSQCERYNKLIAACLTKGGAECWVQVELDAKYKTLPDEPTVQREQAIYTYKNLSVDFLISNVDGSMCVELKVESLFQSAGDGHVTIPHGGYKKVEKDVEKLRDKRSEEYRYIDACVVALVWSTQLRGAMGEWLMESGLHYEVEEIKAINDGEEYIVSVYVIEI
ncbi:hypothetical protein [Colwellia sp. BRX10-4]|uniref:hypothetical protein n=1 Tax=Colwellia sp. BRX10-4 TaxID=2759843 RepID=UPI0015F5531B|nr:hypothetical protein [Colwellia sp. BRX10-4]MBA6398161.1 hypothetical protein [Colwellia sp. BRX10-4]